MFSEVKDCKVREMIDVSEQLYLGHGEHYGIGEVVLMRKACGKAQISTIGVWCQTKKSNLTDYEHLLL